MLGKGDKYGFIQKNIIERALMRATPQKLALREDVRPPTPNLPEDPSRPL